MLRNDVRKPAWNSMSLSRSLPVFKVGYEYALRTRKAIYNLCQVLRNGGSQIVVEYRNDRNEPIREGVMIADIVSAREIA
jgi:hypothetical protein